MAVAAILGGFLIALTGTQQLMAARTSEPAGGPSGQLTVLAVTDGSEHTLAHGSTVPRGTDIAFEAKSQGVSFLYLLRRSEGELESLYPPSFEAWLPSSSPPRVVPHGADQSPGSVGPDRWNPSGAGLHEFILIGSTGARALASDSRVSSLEDFLVAPPYLVGDAAAPAVVLSRMSITWQQE